MKSLASVLALLAVVALVGCSHGPYQARTYKPGTTSLEHTEKVVYDASVKGKVRLVDTRATTLPDGRLEAYAELENTTKKNMVVQVQTQFKDAAGVLLADETAWENLVLPPNTSTGYRAAAMNTQARDYIIRVKMPQPAKGAL